MQCAEIVPLVCLEPIAKGLHITHWISRDLARQAVEDCIVAHISVPTVRRILHQVDLQPHRTRYWETTHLDAQFKQGAEKIGMRSVLLKPAIYHAVRMLGSGDLRLGWEGGLGAIGFS
jgi:hypothetical protein